jgi:hypothetical protein
MELYTGPLNDRTFTGFLASLRLLDIAIYIPLLHTGFPALGVFD